MNDEAVRASAVETEYRQRREYAATLVYNRNVTASIAKALLVVPIGCAVVLWWKTPYLLSQPALLTAAVLGMLLVPALVGWLSTSCRAEAAEERYKAERLLNNAMREQLKSLQIKLDVQCPHMCSPCRTALVTTRVDALMRQPTERTSRRRSVHGDQAAG